MVLYRYLKKQYIEAFKENGILRMTLLSHQRDNVGVRKDHYEGIVPYLFSISGDFSEEESYSLFRRRNQISIGGRGILQYNVHLPEAFVLSTSLNPNLSNHFTSDFFKILNAEKFNEILVNGLSKKYKNVDIDWFHGPVEYVKEKTRKNIPKSDLLKLGRPISEAYSIMDYLIKDKKYSEEEEYRYIFFIKGKLLEKEIVLSLDLKEISKLCSFHL